MLSAVSSLEGCPVRASDGDVGSVRDFLFDDQNWKILWMVVGAGHSLPGRRLLIHPSAIAPLELPPKPLLPMMSPEETLGLTVNLTKAQIEAGPHLREDEPVTKDMEALLYDYYGWDPYWGATHFGAAVLPNAEARIVGDAARREAAEIPPVDSGDRLHSAGSIRGYHVHPWTATSAMSRTALADEAREDELHRHFGWPGYGRPSEG